MKKILFMSFLWAVTLGMAQENFYVHTTTAENILSSVSFLDHPDLNGNPNANPITSHCWDCSGTGADNNNTTGVYYDPSTERWSVFKEDGSEMAVGKTFFVYIPSSDYSFKITNPSENVYLHLNHPQLNGHPEKSVVMNNEFKAVYNDKNCGFWYNSDVDNWVIYDNGGGALPAQASFVIAFEGEPGIESYIHQATNENTSNDCTSLNHPSLNGNTEAKLVFSHNWGVTGNSSNVMLDKVITTEFNSTNNVWTICNEDYSEMPLGATFNILLTDGTMSVNDVNENQNITVFPNPVIDYLNINSPNIMHQVEIYDMTGKQLRISKLSSKSVQLNISELPSGVYVAKVQTDKGTETVKIMKK